ncbi:MAG: TetR/AcrR family transcriptional regulator [Yoonia sp.]|nr:TetR/AcrR family transcriptional regulator [Yoonia sp.]
MARKQGSHSDITGPKVREAALHLIARHGYAAVSMRQIAAEVGVQAGALYNYTPNKQSLLFDIMRVHMEDVLASWDAQDKTGTALKRLERFTRFHITFNLPRADEVFISYMEMRNLSSENFDQIETMRRKYETGLEDILRDGVAQGQFALPDLRITTMALIALLNGLNTWYRENGRLGLAEVERIYWDLVRKSVAV